MPELRWALVVLGVLFIAGLAIWEWRRSRRRHAQVAEASPGLAPQGGGEAWQRRVEPRIDSLAAGRGAREPADALLGEVPVIQPMSPVEVSLPVAAGAAVDVPAAAAPASSPAPASSAPATSAPATSTPPSVSAAAPAAAASLPEAGSPAAPASASGTPQHARTEEAANAGRIDIRWPPERADRVLTLRVANAHGALLQGRAVRLALEQAGLVPGPQTIYHRIDAQGNVLASIANMLRPGDLDPAHMDEQQFRGLSLFSVLPGSLPPVRMLEELVGVARAVAWRLGAVVQDDQGVQLEGERLMKLRQSLPDATEHGTA